MGTFLSTCCSGAGAVDEEPRGRRRQRTEGSFPGTSVRPVEEAYCCIVSSPSALFHAHQESERTSSYAQSNRSKPSCPDKRPLRKVRLAWRSAEPLSHEELQTKRRQFWETVVSFGGKEEIWNALRTAIEIADDDLNMATVILESAGVILPNGLLTEVYDETGFKYDLPIYVLCNPTNVSKSGGSSLTSRVPSSMLRSRSGSSLKHAKKLTIRLDSGRDLVVNLGPSIKTIGDLAGEVIRLGQLQIQSNEKLLFFYSGHGPFSEKQSLEELDLSPTVPLQAWIPTATKA